MPTPPEANPRFDLPRFPCTFLPAQPVPLTTFQPVAFVVKMLPL
jgi:hypothetical protein